LGTRRATKRWPQAAGKTLGVRRALSGDNPEARSLLAVQAASLLGALTENHAERPSKLVRDVTRNKNYPAGSPKTNPAGSNSALLLAPSDSNHRNQSGCSNDDQSGIVERQSNRACVRQSSRQKGQAAQYEFQSVHQISPGENVKELSVKCINCGNLTRKRPAQAQESTQDCPFLRASTMPEHGFV